MSLFSPHVVVGGRGGLAFPNRLSLSWGEDAALGSSVKSVGWVLGGVGKAPNPLPQPPPPPTTW